MLAADAPEKGQKPGRPKQGTYRTGPWVAVRLPAWLLASPRRSVTMICCYGEAL
jgi:hypothetical protein